MVGTLLNAKIQIDSSVLEDIKGIRFPSEYLHSII